MSEKQSKTRYIIIRIIGVLVAVLLIACMAFAAFRIGQRRGLLAVLEVGISSADIENAPWVHPFMFWHRFSFFGNMFMVILAIFLLCMVIGLIFGLGPRFRGCPHRRWHNMPLSYAPHDPFWGERRCGEPEENEVES